MPKTIPVEVDDELGASKESTSLNITLHKPETTPIEVDNAVSLNITIPKTTCTPIEVKDESDISKQTTLLNSTIPNVIPIDEDNDSDTPSHAWIRLNGITLYEIDKYS